MARETPEDPYAGLAPEDMLLRAAPHDLELDDGGVATPQTLKEMALAAEAAARPVPGVTNSAGGSASIGRATVAIARSPGFEAGDSGPPSGPSSSPIPATCHSFHAYARCRLSPTRADLRQS